MIQFNIKDKFNKELPSDPNTTNIPRQVLGACYSYVNPKTPLSPKLIHVSQETANLLGLTSDDINAQSFIDIFSGRTIIENSKPYAMCYGGHQFGNWAGQLGDGRAINLTEVEHQGHSWTLQLKGAGETPYSRRADGLAVLRSSIREHLCSEAMFHLGVPTTRSLSLMLSGNEVLRDVMYDGNAALEKGAIVCRVAPSFIRFGNFQIFASRGNFDTLRKLVDFTIKHYYPSISQSSAEGYIDFFKQVADRTLEMIVHWQRVGFVHGVMNTDNMSILGLTIDYGPYGWLEGYDPHWTPNTTDRQSRRYRYAHQPNSALWNLWQLANALFPLVEKPEPLQEILEQFKTNYHVEYVKMMNSKLGLINNTDSNKELIIQLEDALQMSETDMTIFFRSLANFKKDTKVDESGAYLDIISDAFYKPDEIKDEILTTWTSWFLDYQKQLQEEPTTDSDRKAKMNKVNPKYVLRNYMAQLAIDAADEGDYSLIQEMYELLKQPYEAQSHMEKWFSKRPEWARHKVGCSMLSCSS